MYHSPADKSANGASRGEAQKHWREHAGFSELYDYWNSGRDAGNLPRADKFDLLALTQWLPDIALLDVFGPEDIVCRFAGTAMVDRIGFDLTRKNIFSMQSDATRKLAIKAYSAIINQPCGVIARYTNHYSSGRSGTVRALYLPLSAPASGNARIVCMIKRDEDATYAAPIEQTNTGTEIQSLDWIDLGFGVPPSLS